MNVSIFGDRRIRLPRSWSKETVVGILGDTTLDASDDPAPGASLTVVGMFSDTTVRVPPGRRVVGGGFSLFGDRRIDVGGGDGGDLQINCYGLFCDLKVTEQD